MLKFGCALAVCGAAMSPAQAKVVQIDFNGAFASAYSTPAYQIGTPFIGLITLDTAIAPNSLTKNSFGTFSQFANAGNVKIKIGSDEVFGTIGVATDRYNSGLQNVRLSGLLNNGYNFTLTYLLSSAVDIGGAEIPADAGVYTGTPTGSISNAQMHGNFGPASARGVVIAAVPEMSSWALMLVGFGMIARPARYRRSRRTIIRV